MKQYKILFTAIILCLVFPFCDKIEPPYTIKVIKPDTTYIFPPDTEHYRVMLLEKFTGHLCPNCPAANDKAEQLSNTFGNKLVIFSAHIIDFFAGPTTAYPDDLRSETYGTVHDVPFGIGSLPKGVINRMKLSNFTEWESDINDSINQLPVIDINIKNFYDTSTRKLNTFIQTIFLNNLNSNYKLAVYLMEDSIISAQLNGLTRIPDYVHRHVARAAINSKWGDDLASGLIKTDSIIIKSYAYILNSKWDSSHCYVVAFVYDDNHTTFSDAKYILQAAEAPVIEK
jgi:thiol-disulfide isomerase/thioredoxin